MLTQFIYFILLRNNKSILVTLLYLCASTTWSQKNGISFGIKINPCMTVVLVHDGSNFDDNNFKIINYQIRPQLGLVSSVTRKKFIIDYMLFLSSKKVGFMFNNFAQPASSNYDKIYYKTTIISNKLHFAHLVVKSANPFYRVYVGFNLGLDFNAVTGESGRGQTTSLQSNDSIIEYLPGLPNTYSSLTTGISLKVRAKSKKSGLFDIGLTYDVCLGKHPALAYRANVANKKYEGKLVPILDCFSLDFIWYFKTKEKKEQKKEVKLKDDCD